VTHLSPALQLLVVVVVLLYGLVCTRLQHSKNIQSCIASQWKSNTDNKTLLLLKWNLHSIIHRKYKTFKNISSKVCGCYMARLTLSKNSNSASLTILLYRLFTLLSITHSTQRAATHAFVKQLSVRVCLISAIYRRNYSHLSSVTFPVFELRLGGSG